MPPDLARDLAERTLRLYSEAEEILLRRVARRLARGIDQPGWYETKLREVQQLRRDTKMVLGRLAPVSLAAVVDAVRTGYDAGAGAVAAEFLRAGPGASTTRSSVRALMDAAADRDRTIHVQLLRSTLDTYRDLVIQIAGLVLVGTLTRREASARLVARMGREGLTFTDQSGRRWEAASYAEMAVRTATAHASRQGQLDRLTEAGFDLVIVSDSPQECAVCRPFEGRILSIGTAGARTVEMEHATDDGRMVTVRIAGSVAEAVAAGLYHPQCSHGMNVYLPGVTTIPHGTADPAGDTARRRLRQLEREVRAAKREAAVALTSQARRTAEARVRAYQARIREHVATSTATRRPERERITGPR